MRRIDLYKYILDEQIVKGFMRVWRDSCVFLLAVKCIFLYSH